MTGLKPKILRIGSIAFVAVITILVGRLQAWGGIGGVPIDSESGAAVIQRTDLTVGKIYPIAITRNYNSKSGYIGTLGYGWASSYDRQLYALGDGSVLIRTGPGRKAKYAASDGGFVSPTNDSGTLTFDGTAGTYRYAGQDGSSELYDQFGRLTKMINPRGGSLVLTYDPNGKFPLKGSLPSSVSSNSATVIANLYHLVKIEEYNETGIPTGRWVSFAYDTSNGMLTTLTDDMSRTVSFGHDIIGNLTSVSGPGVSSTYEYTDSLDNHLLTVVNEGHGAYINSYDAVGKITSQVHGRTAIDVDYIIPAATSKVTTTVRDAAGNVKSVESRTVDFNAQRQVVKETDTHGNQIVYARNGQTWITRKEWWRNTGSVAAPALVLHHALEYSYDDKGNVLTMTEMDGATAETSSYAHRTTYTYDMRGNVLTLTNSLGQVATYTYNDGNLVLTVNSPQGNAVNTYDGNGNLITATDAAGATTTFDYDPHGNIRTVTDANGKTTTYAYDCNDRLASVTDPTGDATGYTYDANGNMLTLTVGDGKVTAFTYDSMNRLVTMTDPMGNVTTYVYDANGNRSAVIDANGNATGYTYNDQGQVETVTDASGQTTTYSYGGTGCSSCGGGGGDNLVGVTDAKGQTTEFRYDFLKKVTVETDPLLNETSFTYHPTGNLAIRLDADGRSLAYAYDPLNRLTGVTYPDGSAVSYSYDAAGRMATAANANVGYVYGYDAAGRLALVEDSRGYTLAYENDPVGNRKRTVLRNGTGGERVWEYAYDGANRPIRTTSAAGTFSYAYDLNGRRSTLTYPNLVVASYGYDAAGRLESIRHAAGTTTIASSAYTFDRVGNRTTKTGMELEQYVYDSVYRLLSVVSSRPEAFTYDAVGNRLSGPGSEDVGYTYSAANQMLQGRNFSCQYDKNGGQTVRTNASSVGWTQTWDYEKRLVKVERGGDAYAETVTFLYDPFGRRIGKEAVTVQDGVTKTSKWMYVYDNDDIAMEVYGEDGAETETFYTHGPAVDEHLAMERDNLYYYYHSDGLGSTVGVTDADRNVVQSYEYGSFGEVEAATGFRNYFTYTGREWDKETGLYYYRARYYDPMEGRFISKDPISFAGGDVNLYGYVRNNPINYFDPSGNYTEVLVGLPIRNHLMSQFGHVAINIDGQVYSKGTDRYAKIDFSDYMNNQMSKRDTVGLVLNLTPEEEAILRDALEQRVNGKQTPWQIKNNSCSSNAADVLEKVGIEARGPWQLGFISPADILINVPKSGRVSGRIWYGQDN